MVRFLVEDAANGGRPKVQTRPGKYLSNLRLAKHRAERLEPLHDISRVLRELVHRFTQLYECVRSLLVNAFHPRCNRCGRHQELLRRLLKRPVAGRFQFHDGHAFRRFVLWTADRWNRCHADTGDAELFSQECDLLSGSAEFRLQSDTRVRAICAQPRV